MYVGRVIGKDLREVRFRTPRTDIEVGEILVCEDRNITYLLRVVNIEHGAEGGGMDWTERAAGAMIAMDDMNEILEIHDRERRLYCIAVCSILGAIREGEFVKSKTLPSHFARIRKCKPEDIEPIRKYMGDIRVGRLRSGSAVVEVPVGISGDDLPYHIGIFATTGMGKSNLMKVLAVSVMESGRYGLLILDPHGEYYGSPGRRGLSHHPLAKERLTTFSSHPLPGPYTPIGISAREIAVDDLMQLYDFTPAQRDALNSARKEFGDEWLIRLMHLESSELVESLRYSQEVTFHVIKRKLRNLFRSNILTEDPDISISKTVYSHLKDARVVLIDTSALGEAEEVLIFTVLTRYILERNRSAYGSEEFDTLPSMLITLEEAQRVLPAYDEARTRNVFAEVAREGRKFKTGLCAISQQPKLIDPEVISQFNTFFILGLSDRRDRDMVRDSAKQDISSLGIEIQTLMAGEALLTTPRTPFPIPLKVHLFDDLIREFREQKTSSVLDRGFF